MSITALRETLRGFLLVNPSHDIANGGDRDVIVQTMRDAQSIQGGLYCPHCFEKLGEKKSVRFRNATDKRVHFYHKGENAECANWSGEGEDHKRAKYAIAADLESKGCGAEIKIDCVTLKDDEKQRKPDVLATYPNGAIEAHEIQLSPISIEVWKQRTNDQKSLGCASVRWYFGSKISSELILEASKSSIECYRLKIDDLNVTWKLIERPKEKAEKPLEPIPYKSDKPLYRHIRKPDWVGEFYDHPWGMEGVMLDLIWIASPNDEHLERKRKPERYPVRDLYPA